MEKYFENLIEDYGKILDNEFADLKKRMLGKLEKMLNGKNSDENLQENLLDKPLDYSSILENVKNKGFLTKITNSLKTLKVAEDIKTYKDLQRECYKYFTTECKNKRSWKNEKAYSSYLQHFRNFGKKGVYVVISHLMEINFDFSEESAKKAFEKNKGSL